MNDQLRIPFPTVRPMSVSITQAGVQAVWDTFVVPDQATGLPQSIEMRCLVAILRAVYEGLEQDV